MGLVGALFMHLCLGGCGLSDLSCWVLGCPQAQLDPWPPTPVSPASPLCSFSEVAGSGLGGTRTPGRSPAAEGGW